MKLLTVFPSTIRGGAEEHALTIASAAAKEGWEVHAAFPQTNGTASLIQDFTAKGMYYHPLDIAVVEGRDLKLVREYLPQFFRTIILLLQLKPDVVQVNLPWPNRCLSTLLACGFLNTATVVLFHLISARMSFTNTRLKAYSWAKSRNQRWIAVSENNRKLVCESFQIPHEQVLRIYNGAKVKSAFANSTPDELTKLRCQVRQELGISETTRILLTVGRLDSQKGYNDIIPVIPHILKECSDIKFIWVGDGEQRNYLIKKLKEYGVEDHVLFLGYRSDVPRLLQSADLFIFPTHYEGGQSIALAEAMGYGLPIIASDASGIPEVIENRVHGLLFPTGNSDELLAAIRWALNHPDSMAEMAQKAQLRLAEFSEDKMIEETLTVFKELLPSS